MNDWMMALFVLACGLTSAGMLNSICAIVTGTPARFRLGAHPVLALLSFAIIMFAGPYVLARNVLLQRQSRRLSFSLTVFAACIFLVWSFCAGIFVVQILALAGLIRA